MARAYTRIDHASAVVGNDWTERVYSAFLCTTLELKQKLADGYVEWIATSGPDFVPELDGVLLAPIALGPPEWSETRDALGATLISRRTGNRLTVTIHTTALHEHPGLVREIEIRNPGTEPVRLTRVGVEVLGLRSDGAGILTHGLAKRAESIAYETDEPMVAAELAGYGRLGLLLGMEQGGRHEMFEPDSKRCVLALRGVLEIPPGRKATLPRTFLTHYTGEPGLAVSGSMTEVLRMLDNQRLRESCDKMEQE